MNVLTHEQQLEEQCPPPLPARIRHLEFNDVRAGRLVAESIHASLASAVEYVEKALLRSRELWDVAVREVPLTISGSHSRKVAITTIPRRAFDIELAGVLLPREAADMALVMPENEDDDEAIVQWFDDLQSAAERAMDAAPPHEEDVDQGEVVLGQPGGLRSMSWRGGGTMRRR